MKLTYLAALLPIAVALSGAAGPLDASPLDAETPKTAAAPPAKQLAKKPSYSLGRYIRCYQRAFHACLKLQRQMGTNGVRMITSAGATPGTNAKDSSRAA